ncbi:hypothetical protein B0H67DRAFT_610993 [Lasiosphaeris hirsuta]|uniref:C2H2-type domain-containing protein n=1 Tax=Lasiosphaeris hirsuta TaxID=260670 RepID=A0AA40A7Q6_9PEZI|nr:hypothetical protein B0H67DRAFT_610993 [Lasiosphaeris hirsuta]
MDSVPPSSSNLLGHQATHGAARPGKPPLNASRAYATPLSPLITPGKDVLAKDGSPASNQYGSDSGVAVVPQSPRVTISVWNPPGDYSFDDPLDQPLLSAFSPLCPSSVGGEAPDLHEPVLVRADKEDEKVNTWLATCDFSQGFVMDRPPSASLTLEDGKPDSIPAEEVPLGDVTENRRNSAQIYYTSAAGTRAWLTQENMENIPKGQNWADAPLSLPITKTRHQPDTSQAAIEKFERACRDDASDTSIAATWGTQRQDIAQATPINDTEDRTIEESPQGKERRSFDNDKRRNPSKDFVKFSLPLASAHINWTSLGTTQDTETLGTTRASSKVLEPPGTETGKEIEHLTDELEHNETVTDATDDSMTEEAKTVSVGRIHNARSPRTFRQVGFGKIRLDLVTLLSQYVAVARARTVEVSEDASFSSGSSEIGDGDGDGDQDAEARSDKNSHVDPAYQAAGISAGPTTAAPATSANKRAAPNENTGNDEEDGDSPKRRRLNPKAPDTSKSNLARFACPYQTYEPFRSCLRRTKRNPEGGCDGIIRLKQHLARKHMVSHRCPRCWISFDTRRKAADHRDKGGCIEKRKPDDECFMDPWHESQVEKAYSSTSEEETWWNLFRLLVSSVQGLDEAKLKARYWPYYVYLDVSLMIPALTFSDVSFHALGTSSQGETIMFNSTEALNLGQPDPLSSTTGSAIPSSSGLSYSLEPQSLSVPIYAAYSQAPDALSPFDSYQSPTHSVVFTPSTIVDSRSRPSNPSSSPDTADTNANQTPGPVPDPPSQARENLEAQSWHPQPQRNAERLRQRLTQTEAENEELRETHRLSHVGFGHVHLILCTRNSQGCPRYWAT